MSDKLATVMPKIAPLLRMLGSCADGEIVNAIRALLRLLTGAGLDIHALVERIENPPLSASEMQKIYDTAYAKGHADGAEQGRRSVVLAATTPIGVTHVDDDVNGYSWQQVAAHCAANRHLFSGKALSFIDDMPDKIAAFGRPTPGQAKWLRDLFMQKFGGRI